MVIEEAKLKQLFHDTFVEVLESKKEMLYDVIVEAMEDAAMVQAIKEGESSGSVSRDEIFDILEKK